MSLALYKMPLESARPPRPKLVRIRPESLASLTDAEIEERVEAAHLANVIAARESSAAFVEFAITSEETGAAIRNAPIHEEWHELLEDRRRVAIAAPVEHGKTQQIGIGRLLWCIGKNPNGRFAIISNTAPQAEKILGAIRAHIERNPRVLEVFPHLRPSSAPEAPWGKSAITVERDRISKDPTLQALGVHGAINGSRLDGVLLDDVLDFENTATPEQCSKVIEWIDTTVLTRATAIAWIALIGTPWSQLDALHALQGRKGWTSRTYSAVENPDEAPNLWRPTWPEQWPLERLIERMEGMLPLTFARKYLCRVISSESARFKPEWIANARALGRGRTLLPRRPVVLPSRTKLPCFTGVDLGASRRKRKMLAGAQQGAGLTVFFTIAIDQRARRLVVGIEVGRWTSPEILSRLASIHERYESQILVEDNGAQAFLTQFATSKGIPILEFTTTAGNKYDEVYGVESIAVEFRSGLWVIPSGADGQTVDPEVAAWEGEMLTYTPEAHTGDRLMASWFAREGARSLIATMTKHMPTQDR